MHDLYICCRKYKMDSTRSLIRTFYWLACVMSLSNAYVIQHIITVQDDSSKYLVLI